MSKERKNKVNVEVEDKYSASYYKKIADYKNSTEKIYNDIILDIFSDINEQSLGGRHFTSISIYSVNYFRAAFEAKPNSQELKKETLKRVKEFLISKGFKCNKNGVQLEIDWFCNEK